MADIMQYPAEVVMGKNLVEDFITPEYRSSVKDVLQRALCGDETSNYEVPLITKDGRRLEVLLNATPRYDYRGNVTGGPCVCPRCNVCVIAV